MGILDEAIREHLELKRQHGAEGDELKRLEDEAFGPPTRPGEPDFPEAGAAAGEVEPATTVVESDASGTERENGAHADESPPAPASEGEETPGPPAPEAPAAVEEPPTGEVAAPEQEAAEHAIVDDQPEPKPAFYDQSLEDELGEIDLGGEDGPPPAEDAAPPPVEPPSEPAIESLETIEHPFEPLSDEHPVEPASEELELDESPSDEHALEPASDEHAVEPASDEQAVEPAHPDDESEAEEEDEPGSSEEDVLADTPEFLRDAPEDDELWFEQGQPKDFDFD